MSSTFLSSDSGLFRAADIANFQRQSQNIPARVELQVRAFLTVLAPTSFDKGWSQVLGPWDGVKLQREQTWEGSWWEEGGRWEGEEGG